MKRLYILRHAQKENDDYKDDYDIELTQEGIKQCELISNKLKQKDAKFDLIVSSPAKRAKQTAQLVADNLVHNKQIVFNEVLYNAFLNELIESITYTYDTVENLLVVGHNPSLGALAYTFCGFRQAFDMGSVIRIDFDCNSWIDIDKSNAKLVFHEEAK